MRKALYFILSFSFASLPAFAIAAAPDKEEDKTVLKEQQSVHNLLQIVALSGYLAGAESHCDIRHALTIKACLSLVVSHWSDISGVKLSHPDDATGLATVAWEKSLDDGQHAITSQKACPDIENNAEQLEIFSLCRSSGQSNLGKRTPHTPENEPSDEGNHVIHEDMSIQ